MAPPLTLDDAGPLVTADPLVAHTCRAALEAYLRGDYRRAAERLLDARAICTGRPDWAPFESLLATLEFQLASGALVSRDCGHVAAPQAAA
jgi:hypothetical protein